MIITKRESGKISFYWDNNAYLGYSYCEVDGFYVFVFDGNNGGCWSDYALRAIADKLTELNAEWIEQIDEYFKQKTNK
jgi:hypothetical protein